MSRNENRFKKWIYLFDIVVVAFSLIGLLWLVGYARPLVIAPLDGLVTSDSSVLFSFEKGNIILIDDNLEFSSPEKIYAEDNLIINLAPGMYYWKIVGVISSEIRELNITSRVDLKVRALEDNTTYSIINGGNVPLDVEVYSNGTVVNKIILDVDQRGEAKGEEFIGGQKK